MRVGGEEGGSGFLVWGCLGACLGRTSAWLSWLPLSPYFPSLLLLWDLNLVWNWARVLLSWSNWMPIMMLGLFLTSTSSPSLIS